MNYTYFELTDLNKDDLYIVELSFSNYFEIENIYLKVYGLNVYYISIDSNVNYPLIFEKNISFKEKIDLNSINLNEIIIENIFNSDNYYDLNLNNPYCHEIIYNNKKYQNTSLISDICKYEALNSMTCIFDIVFENENLWIIRRNGQIIGYFNPSVYQDYYDPNCNGNDSYCYLGDKIIVNFVSKDFYTININQTNYLSYKLHNLGIMWLKDHGYK